MKKPSKWSPKTVGGIITILTILLIVRFAVEHSHPPSQPQSYFRPAPTELTLAALGTATNYLKFDHEHDWKAFCVSNGTSKPILYIVTEVEYRTAGGWRSAGDWISGTITNTSLMTHRDSTGEILPGSNDVFYASVSSTNLPWRLRVGCIESGWRDSSFFKGIGAAISGRPKLTNSKSWSGARYELIGEEIKP